jgi:hypothetical protein
MTTPTIDLAPLRDVIRAIWELPEGKVSDPLALLEMRIRHALAAYDASEEMETPVVEQISEVEKTKRWMLKRMDPLGGT